jgi:hypothetical protein
MYKLLLPGCRILSHFRQTRGTSYSEDLESSQTTRGQRHTPSDKRKAKEDSLEGPISKTAVDPGDNDPRRGGGKRNRSRIAPPAVSSRVKRSRADSVRAARLSWKDMSRRQERWCKLATGIREKQGGKIQEVQ